MSVGVLSTSLYSVDTLHMAGGNPRAARVSWRVLDFLGWVGLLAEPLGRGTCGRSQVSQTGVAPGSGEGGEVVTRVSPRSGVARTPVVTVLAT